MDVIVRTGGAARAAQAALALFALLVALAAPGPLLAQMAADDVQALAADLGRAAGRTVSVDVVEGPGIFSTVRGDRIRVSRPLLDAVYARSGREGVAFMLGHEVAHGSVAPAVRGAAVELEADRLGFAFARKAVPTVSGQSVRKVLGAFDAAGNQGLAGAAVDHVRGALQVSHPTDAARLYELGRANGFSRSMGLDDVGSGSGFLARRDDAPRSPTRASGLRGAAASLKSNFSRGGLGASLAVTLGLSVIDRVRQGGSVGEGVREAARYVGSSTFLLGDLAGGALGAALGAMIPLPGALCAAGLLGQSLAGLPALGGAMLGAQVGVTAVTLLREGRFSFRNLAAEVDLVGVLVRAVGASVGMAAGSLLPVPWLGPAVGGLVGGMLADKLLQALRGGEAVSADRPSTSSSGSGSGSGSGVGSDLGSGSASAVAKVSVEQLQRARDEAYQAFLCADREGRTADALAELRRYRSLESTLAAARKASSR